ncbi:unnamed protein product, partial [Rotaria magnacalcarata]
DEAADKAAKDLVFFKIRARQLLKEMFTLHDLHWMAATLNPRARLLKLAIDAERTHAYHLVRAEVAKIMEIQLADNNPSVQSPVTSSPPPSPHKKFKSYTAQFDDDTFGESNKNITISKRAQRKFEKYLQMKLTKCTLSKDNSDNPLLFWKEQEQLLPNMSKLAKKNSIPASSATVERSFSSAGVIISHVREEPASTHLQSMTSY